MKIGIILVTVLATLAMVLAGCVAPETAQARGTLQIMVTDAPPEDEVASINVTVESVAVHKAVAEQEQEQKEEQRQEQEQKQEQRQEQEQEQEQEQQQSTANSTDEEADWLPLDILEGKETFDVLKIQGIEEVLAVAELEAGKYTQIRMTIDNVQVKLGDGDLQDAKLPSGKLKFIHPFNIIAGETTALLFDFDAEKSVNVAGSHNIIVKPVVKLTLTRPQAIGPATAKMAIATASLPNGAVDVSYNATLATDGGTTPYTWSIHSGTLPAGLSLHSASGVISGTPTTSGNSTFTVKVSDNSTPVRSDTQQYSVTIAASGALIIITTDVADGVEDTAYNATLVALGGTAPYAWSVASGNLPDGLAMDTASGVISGTPTTKGDYNFTLQVSDNATPADTDTQQLNIRLAEN